MGSFYEQLSLSTIRQPLASFTDASKSMTQNASMANASSFHAFVRPKRGKYLAGDEEVRRHVERLLLRLDFNGGFSKPTVNVMIPASETEEILKQGGFA